jgi:hypothetical protein
MKTTASILILVLSLAACSDEPEYFRMPGGSQPGQLDRDTAACNNEARAIVGVNRYVHFNQVRRDCLIGRGWVPV